MTRDGKLTPTMAPRYREDLLIPLIHRPDLYFAADKNLHEWFDEDLPPGLAEESMKSIGRLMLKSTIVLWDADLWRAAVRGHEAFIGQTFEESSFLTDNLFMIPDADITLLPEAKIMMKLPDHIDILQAVHYHLMRRSDAEKLTKLIRSKPGTPQMTEIMLRGFHENGTIMINYFFGHYTENETEFRRQLIVGLMQKGRISKMHHLLVRLLKIAGVISNTSMSGNSPTVGQIPLSSASCTQRLSRIFSGYLPPVVELVKDLASRQVRREAARKNIELPDVRIVRLRRAEHQADDHESATVDWHWQWIVNGHWRKQWYPSEKTHKPVFIAPYIKGPEGKPLKPMQEALYVVNR